MSLLRWEVWLQHKKAVHASFNQGWFKCEHHEPSWMLDTDVHDQSALKPVFVTTGIGTVQLAWITPLSKCVNISTMNRSSQPLYHLILARQECDYNNLSDSKMMADALGTALKLPWFHKPLFPVAQIKRKGCRQKNLTGLGPQHCGAALKDNSSVGSVAFSRRKDPQRKGSPKQLDRCLQKGQMSDQGGFCYHSRHSCFAPFQLLYRVTKQLLQITLCSSRGWEYSSHIDPKGLLAGRTKLQRYEILWSASYTRNQRFFSL